MPAPELSLTEAMLLRRFEAAPAAPESYAPNVIDEDWVRPGRLADDPRTRSTRTELILVDTDACPSRSHGPDGWHCAITGEHVMHLNAARTVGWQ